MDDLDRILEEVERLDREATPGPWDADHSWWPGEDEDEYAAVGPVHKLRKYDFLDLNTPEKRAGLDVAMMGIRADENLIATFRTAAPLLAAEVRRLRAGGCARDQRTTQFCAEAVAKDAEIVRLRDELDSANAAVDAAFAERDQYMQGQTEATAIARDLRAQLEEARLILAAEQGRQEGAPKGWEYSGQMWHRGHRRAMATRNGWEWWIRGDNGVLAAEGRADTARAAMLAADAAVG